MHKNNFLYQLQSIASLIGLILVISILLSALWIQFFYDEPPCPLCLLQRAAFVCIGLSLLMNIRYGNKVSHWGMVIIASAVGIAVSIRQILLHITTPQGFGSAILGLHMYTWCFVGFYIAIIGAAIMLLVYPETTVTVPHHSDKI